MVGIQVDRQYVLDAAIAELVTTTAGAVTMAAVARRAGVELGVVKAMWPNSHQLLNAALMSYADQNIPIPDTGSLRDDLTQYAKAFAAALNSPTGKRLFHAIVATPRDWDVSGWRPTFFTDRKRRISPVLRRAVERGDCAPGVDAVRVMDVLTAGLCASLQFYDRPVTDEDCESVVGIVLNGILLKR